MSDILTGADSIAKAIGIRRKQVYALRQRGKAPIRHVDGIGLVASKQELTDYLLGKHQENNLPEEERPG